MKRDLHINYGVLDDIIAELRSYEGALQTMEKSLDDIATLVKTNEGKSVDAWGRNLHTSKDEINRYQEQVDDLLSLFENYVADTTAYISPLVRNKMMRVSRNDIWGNLQQINTGLTNGVTNALVTSYSQPNSFLFGLLEDPTDAEEEASAHNKIQLENIQDSIKSSQAILEEKKEDLKELYNKKVKPFENTDDDYKKLVSKVKKKYTSFFEGIKETFDTIQRTIDDFDKGFWNAVLGMITGIATIALDAGIIVVSGLIPDRIEPEFLKEKADETFDGYKAAALQLIQDPISVVENIAQSVNDTYEREGLAYVTGEAVTILVPASWLKLTKVIPKVKGTGKTKVSNSPYSKEFIQGKINAAKAGLGDVKFPTFTRRELSTGSSNHSVFDIEMKSLSETHPQMFAVKGDGSAKGTGNTSNKIKEISEVNYGDHFTKGKRGRKELTPNVRYVTQDGYKYTTDELGRITNVEADNLILQQADRNLGMQRAAGREDRLPDDDGGHLIGSQFHGPGDIDNLVAQNSQINRSGGQWYKMEAEWANALKETPPRKVSVKIEPIYLETSLRPDSFEIMYEIEGKGIFEKIIKNKSGG